MQLFAYTGNYDVQFYKDNDPLKVTIETDRLSMRSITEEDSASYTSLLSGSDIVGKPKTAEEIAGKINHWVALWKQKDPFSALTIFDSGTDEFLGYIMLDHGIEAGQAELKGYCVKSEHCKGLGTEATTAMIKGYAPALIKEGYQLQGKLLEKVTAMANANNGELLTHLGMNKVEGESRCYSLTLNKA
jgi:Acetyltransferase (GNAT) domain